MKIDLCKLFGVEEGEEFKVNNGDTIFFITDNVLQYKLSNFKSEVSKIKINEIVEITILPKKKRFSQDTLNFFKCIDKKFDWIAKDKDENINVFTHKPYKKYDFWIMQGACKCTCRVVYGINQSLFDKILWEDEEPIRIDDYVER